MKFQEAVDWVYSTQGLGIKLGLENIERLLEALGLPVANRESQPRNFPLIIHVAGTNGKGSTCAMMEAICREGGLKTGLFTSPHLITYRERIRVDHQMIPEKAVAKGLSRIRELVADWEAPPTFFEITTALGMLWFMENKVEVIILETGLGGRLDSTNALPSSVAVIMPIGLDHCQFLGNSLTSVAKEKAGIFKPGARVILAPQPSEARMALLAKAQMLELSVTEVNTPTPLDVALLGSHQKMNAAVAIAALQTAKLAFPESIIEAALQKVAWPGRFHAIALPQYPSLSLIVDGAHNPPAAEQLLRTWREEFGEAKTPLLLAMMGDKDVATLLRILTPLASHLILTQVQNERSCAAEHLAEIARNETTLPIEAFPTLEAALERATQLQEGAHASPVLATGSLFLVGELWGMHQSSLSTEPRSLQ